MLPVTVDCVSPGRTLSLTDMLDGQPTFATAAIGGFADCTFTLRGDARSLVPYLSLVRITLGATLLYEGQVEDADPAGGPADLKTTVTCFGLRNLLVENTVRRIWSKRDLDWQETPQGFGSTIGIGGVNSITKRQLRISTGAFDQTDLTKKGVQAAGDGVALASRFDGNMAQFVLPATTLLAQILATVTLSGANTGAGKLVGYAQLMKSGGTVANDIQGPTYTTTQAISLAVPANGADIVRLGAYNDTAGTLTPAASDKIEWTDIRLLGATTTEDAAGGFYGGTILRDLVALVPGLTLGVIEDGSDFTVQALERVVRGQTLGVVEEVAGYYTREWAVWEDGRFDWKTRALDQPDWVVTVGDLSSLSLDGTLDGIARTVYVLYTDAASGLDAEASAAATAQRNPYVKQGRAKDLIVEPGFPMTANTSAQLAARLAGDIGQWVPVAGTVTLNATKVVQRALGPAAPAATIRGGDNLLIADLPKTDVFQQGRDGETLFHIVDTTCDLQAGTVTLQLEGQSRRSDVLLARLAAATRVLTG